MLNISTMLVFTACGPSKPVQDKPATPVKSAPAADTDESQEHALVTAEDGPWRIFAAPRDSSGKFITFTEVGAGFMVKTASTTGYTEVFQIPDDKFLSDTLAWRVEVAPPTVNPVCPATEMRCNKATVDFGRDNYPRPDKDAFDADPCGANDECKPIAAGAYHAPGLYEITARINPGSAKVSEKRGYLKIDPASSGWTQALYNADGSATPIPWPNDGVEGDDTSGPPVVWFIRTPDIQPELPPKPFLEFTVLAE